MTKPRIQLPENKKFGKFFCLIFFLASLYTYYLKIIYLTYFLLFLSIVFLLLSYIAPRLLHPLNKIWMGFGYILSLIVKPIILGIIFFIIFTPVSIIMKILRRDELLLKKRNVSSFWKTRTNNKYHDNFNKQY